MKPNSSESQDFRNQYRDGFSSQQSESVQGAPLDRDTITYLWTLMGRLYGHRWSSAYSEDVDPGNVWAAALRGISRDQIRAGFSRLVSGNHAWPPTAIEFRSICEQYDGAPTVQSSKQEFMRLVGLAADKRRWSNHHPALYWIFQQIGGWEIGRMSSDAIERRFKDMWPVAMERHKAGQLAEPPEHQLEAKPREITQEDRAHGQSVLAGLKEMFK